MRDSQNPGSNTPAKDKGDEAEELAANYFVEHGYRVLARNYVAKAGELDLIVERGECLVFVEVRYRRSIGFGSPSETVTPQKQRRIVLSALEYAAKQRLLARRAIRFDVLSIAGPVKAPRITHFEAAFDAEVPGSGGMYSWV